MSDIEKDITGLWARLTPVAGYTSGWTGKLSQLFIPTDDAVGTAHNDISALRSRVGEIDDADLRATATKQLDLLDTQLDYPQPGLAVQDCGDGAFYISLLQEFSRPSPSPWLKEFLTSTTQKIKFETERLRKIPIDIVHKKQCLNAAAYCEQTMTILKDTFRVNIDEVKSCLKEFEKGILGNVSKDLTSLTFDDMFKVLRENTTDPVLTEGYPQFLAQLYDFTSSASDLDATAMTWLAQDMPIVRELATELASLLKLLPDTSVGEVWMAVNKKWAIKKEDVMKFARSAEGPCNDYAREYLLDFEKDIAVSLKETPSYMAPVITGGQDIAVNYLTSTPAACLYLTADKATSKLTLLNIMVHEYSHGFNFVLAAKKAGSPLLNLGGPMQVPLTEAQAFWREWEYWHAAATSFGQLHGTNIQEKYLALYGTTPTEQAQGIRAAQFETYIWRIVRYLRALCDIQVNMGWRTLVDFLDWATKETGLSTEFLFGECFTFLAQPGYAPAYAIDGITYGNLQQAAIKKNSTAKPFNTQASEMGFYPWTICARRLTTSPPP